MWPSNNIVCKITKTNEKKTSEADLGVVKDKGGGEHFLNTSNNFTKSNLSVTVSQRHRQLSAARCGRATTLFAKLLKQTTVLVITSPKVICQSL